MKKIILVLLLCLCISKQLFAWQQNPVLNPREELIKYIQNQFGIIYIEKLQDSLTRFRHTPTRENAEAILNLNKLFLGLLPRQYENEIKLYIACSYCLIFETDNNDMSSIQKAADTFMELLNDGVDFITVSNLEVALVSLFGGYMGDTTRLDYLKNAAELFETGQVKFKDNLSTRALYIALMCCHFLSGKDEENEVEWLEKGVAIARLANPRNDLTPTPQMCSAAFTTLLAYGTAEWGEITDLTLAAYYFGLLMKHEDSLCALSIKNAAIQGVLLLSKASDEFQEVGNRAKYLLLLLVKICKEVTPQEILDAAIDIAMKDRGRHYAERLNAEVIDIGARCVPNRVDADFLIALANCHYRAFKENNQNLSNLVKAAKNYENASRVVQTSQRPKLQKNAALCYLKLYELGVLQGAEIYRAVNIYDLYVADKQLETDHSDIIRITDRLSDLYERSRKVSDLLKCLEYLGHLYWRHWNDFSPQYIKMTLRYLCRFMETEPGKKHLSDELRGLGYKAISWGSGHKFNLLDNEFTQLAALFKAKVEELHPEGYPEFYYMSFSLDPRRGKACGPMFDLLRAYNQSQKK